MHIISFILTWVTVLFYTTASSLTETPSALPELQHLTRTQSSSTTDSLIIYSSDSATIVLPEIRKPLDGKQTPIEVQPRCAVDSVTVFVRHSYNVNDTLGTLVRPPYRFDWAYAPLPDQDQIHLQFCYVIHHP